MSVNFFGVALCQNIISDSLFGLCDNPLLDIEFAHPCTNNKANWIATVKNPNNYEVIIIAVDKCLKIKKPHNGHIDSTCDALLVYNDNIIFVELKERDGNNNKWIRKGDEQLRNTINHFKANHSIDKYIKKVAYLANSEHPQFKSSQKTRMQTFYDEMGVRLRIEATIHLQ